MRYFTHSWAREQYDADLAEIEETGATSVIDNSVGSGFLAVGVAEGDVVYVVNWHEGELSVLGRFVVATVLDRALARAEFGPDFDAEEIAVAQDGHVTYQVFDASVNGPEMGGDDELLDVVEFIEADGTVRGLRDDAGVADPQRLLNVREVTADTASLFDELLGFDPGQVIGLDDATARRAVATDYFIGEEPVASADVLCEAGELLGRWRDADLDPLDDAVLADPEQLADVIWAELQQWAADTDVTILSERAEVVEQLRDAEEIDD